MIPTSLLGSRKERRAETVVVGYTHRYAKFWLCTFSKYKSGLSEIELSAPIFGNSNIFESGRFSSLLHFMLAFAYI